MYNNIITQKNSEVSKKQKFFVYFFLKTTYHTKNDNIFYIDFYMFIGFVRAYPTKSFILRVGNLYSLS